MPYLKLKPNHEAVRTFYKEISQKQQLSFIHEGTVAPHFANLLRYCARQFKWNLIEQYPLARKGRYPLKTDRRSGIVNDPNSLDDPQYIVRLIGQVIIVSLETVEIVNDLSPLN